MEGTEEEEEAATGDSFPKEGNVTLLRISSPPPLSCSFCFWCCSRATLTWRDGHLFWKMGTTLGAAGRTVEEEDWEEVEMRDEAGWKTGRKEMEGEEEEGGLSSPPPHS